MPALTAMRDSANAQAVVSSLSTGFESEAANRCGALTYQRTLHGISQGLSIECLSVARRLTIASCRAQIESQVRPARFEHAEFKALAACRLLSVTALTSADVASFDDTPMHFVNQSFRSLVIARTRLLPAYDVHKCAGALNTKAQHVQHVRFANRSPLHTLAASDTSYKVTRADGKCVDSLAAYYVPLARKGRDFAAWKRHRQAAQVAHC
jgi:hypothetical protein